MKSKSNMKRASLSTRNSCSGNSCKDRCCGWTGRNWIHVILLSAAVGALVGAVLGSLDSCSTEVRNVTSTVVSVTPLATSILLDSSLSMNWGYTNEVTTPSRWDNATDALPVLVNALDSSMNEGGFEEKFSISLVRWSNVNTVVSVLDQTTNITLSSAAIDVLADYTPTGGTYLTGGLCECYNQLEAGAQSGANKLCILIADGVQSGETFGTSCNAVLSDSNGAVTNGNLDSLASYLKGTLNYNIFSILVTDVSGFPKMKEVSDCKSDTLCTAYNDCDSCDYFLYLDDFTELVTRSGTIASNQRTVSQSTEQIQVQSNVSVCSLDFLYALIAFGPFLGYLIYRVIVIKAKSKSIRTQLYEMIRNGELSRDDIRHFATVAANLLLPKNYKSDVDWIISYIMFQCPCLLPASKADLEAVFAASTIAL